MRRFTIIMLIITIFFLTISKGNAFERKLIISDVTSSPGNDIKVPISITDATDIAGADIVVTYDPIILTIKEIKSTQLSSDLKLKYDTGTPGEITIKMTGTKSIPNGVGPLIDMIFMVNANIQKDTDTSVSFKEATIFDSSSKIIDISTQDGKVRIGVCLKGDVNNDGKIDARDAILTLRISVGLVPPTPYAVCAADLNNDGAIMANDAIIILRKIANLEP